MIPLTSMIHLPTVGGKQTSGGRKGQVDGKLASIFLIMVWELPSLELLLCDVHVSVPVCVVQHAVTTDIPISFMFVHTVPK
jgi:hypothetical protein